MIINLIRSISIILPIKDIIKCPAIILVVSRTANVIGRISLLVSSIMTIRGINGVGVPRGTRWANNDFLNFLIAKKIIPIHSLKEIVKFTLILLVMLNT